MKERNKQEKMFDLDGTRQIVIPFFAFVYVEHYIMKFRYFS